MTFGTLKSKVAGYLNRDDLTSIIPDFINMAMHKIERNNDWMCMEQYATNTTSDDYITLPSGFKNIKFLRALSNSLYYNIEPVEEADALSLYNASYTGRPRTYAVSKSQNKILLRPSPDTSYTLVYVYRKFTTDLSLDTDTNWWTDNIWELLLYGALLEAELYIVDDERIAIWKALYDSLLRDLLTTEKYTAIGDRPVIGRTVITE